MQIISGHKAISLLPSSTFVLPHTALTTISLRENWHMDTLVHRAWMNNEDPENLVASTSYGRGGASDINVIDQAKFLQSLQARLQSIEGTNLSNYEATGRRIKAMEER